MLKSIIRIPISDSVYLSASVYRPDTPDPVPVLAGFYPYRKSDFIGSVVEGSRRRFVAHGYADVLIDLRGTGNSNGKALELFSQDEGDDGAAAVEWLASQTWCDGNVGIYGISYGGIIALNVAAKRPHGLKAIVPVYATADIYSKFVYPGGIPNALGSQMWVTFMLALALCPPSEHDDEGRWRSIWNERVERLKSGEFEPLEWSEHQALDAYWERRQYDCSAIEAPTFVIGGWNDIYPDVVDDFEAIAAPKQLVMGPWVHVLPHISEVEPWEWHSEAVVWFDRWLRGAEGTSNSPPPVRFFVQGSDYWTSAPSWPPDATVEVLHLTSSHRLTSAASEESGAYDYDRKAVVGFAGALFDPMGTGLGYPRNQGPDAHGSMTVQTAPLENSREIAGACEAVLFLSGETAELDLVAKLHDVSPSGAGHLVASGFLSVRAADGLAVKHGRPPRVEEYRVRFWNTAYRVPAGHRLQLSVSTTDFPHCFPTDAPRAVQIHYGTAFPTRVEVPVSAKLDCPPQDSDLIQRPVGVQEASPWLSKARSHWEVSEDLVAGDESMRYGLTEVIDLPQGGTFELQLSGLALSPSDPASRCGVECEAEILLVNVEGSVRVSCSSTGRRGALAACGSVAVDGKEVVCVHLPLTHDSEGGQTSPT